MPLAGRSSWTKVNRGHRCGWFRTHRCERSRSRTRKCRCRVVSSQGNSGRLAWPHPARTNQTKCRATRLTQTRWTLPSTPAAKTKRDQFATGTLRMYFLSSGVKGLNLVHHPPPRPETGTALQLYSFLKNRYCGTERPRFAIWTGNLRHTPALNSVSVTWTRPQVPWSRSTVRFVSVVFFIPGVKSSGIDTSFELESNNNTPRGSSFAWTSSKASLLLPIFPSSPVAIPTREERRLRRGLNQATLQCRLLTHPGSWSTFSQPFTEICASDVVRVGSIVIFHLSKLWKAKFFVLCGVILFWYGCRGNLRLITLGSETVNRKIHSVKVQQWDWLLDWYYTTNSHYITCTFLFKMLGECTQCHLWIYLWRAPGAVETAHRVRRVHPPLAPQR